MQILKVFLKTAEVIVPLPVAGLVTSSNFKNEDLQNRSVFVIYSLFQSVGVRMLLYFYERDASF